MDITIRVPDDIGVVIKRLPNVDEFAVEAFREKMERYREKESQQKREAAFQELLKIKPKKLKRDSTDVIREERDKLDARNRV